MPKNDHAAPVTPKQRPKPPGKAPVRRFAQFGVLCLLLSWLPWTILGLSGANIDAGAGSIIFGLAASGPSLAALIMWLRFRRERIRSGVRISWYGPLVGLLLGAAPTILTALILNGGDLSALGSHAAIVAASVGGPAGVIAYTLISGPLSEEFGWRGYLQPRARQHLARLRTAVVLGACWAAWHLPLFLLPGTGQHEMGLLSVGGATFVASLIPLSYTMIFVSERLRGGVWAAIAAHAGFNAAGALMPATGDIGAVIELGLMIIVACSVARVPHASPSGSGDRVPRSVACSQ